MTMLIAESPSNHHLRPPRSTSLRPLLIAASIGAAVSLTLGAYGRIHDPSGETIYAFGFSSLLPMKAWFTSIAALLGLTQALTAAGMFGRLGEQRGRSDRVAATHRWLGTSAFLVSLPVAYHCLWALGLQTTSARVIAHSLLGCAFYGALVTKLLLLRSTRSPAWVVPVAGGLLVTLLTGIWLTSSLWYFTTIGL